LNITEGIKMGQLEKSLIDSLHTGFIDKDKMSLEKYRPKLLINNHKEGRKVLSNIINELERCDEFFSQLPLLPIVVS